MKIFRLFLVLALLIEPFTGNAQFWQGFGMGIFNAMQQQSNNYNHSEPNRSEPVEESIQYEKDGFVWIRLRLWNPQKREFYYGAKDENGKTIIPISKKYTGLFYHSEEGYGGYFAIEKNDGRAVCDRYGKILYEPSKYTDYICLDGNFKKKGSSGDWKDTIAHLDRDGHGYKKGASTSSTGVGWGNSCNVVPNLGAVPTNPTINSGYSDTQSTGSRSAETLNQTVGSACMTCHGTGKCPTCNGTKVASSMGNTYKCTVCDTNGNCPSCHGTGKASWNR